MRPSIIFSPFRLDLSNAQLWEGRTAISLRPKTFALLQLLVEKPGQLLTKNEIFDAVWPDTVVTESTLKVCIRELRKVLGDQAERPRLLRPCIDVVIGLLGKFKVQGSKFKVQSSKFQVIPLPLQSLVESLRSLPFKNAGLRHWPDGARLFL